MRGSKKILVVDDNIDLRDLIEIELEMKGFEVVHARNGHDALRVLQTERNIHLAVTDFYMPIANGDVVKAYCDEHKIPCIVMSTAREDLEGYYDYFWGKTDISILIEIVLLILA
ncbi:MAG: response regulator [Patescibacteria group bacterium]|nr:response regulator [Patescibacteria group bacterium]